MKITLQQIPDGQDEVIIRYRELTEQIDQLIQSIRCRRDKIYAEKGGEKMLIAPDRVCI